MDELGSGRSRSVTPTLQPDRTVTSTFFFFFQSGAKWKTDSGIIVHLGEKVDDKVRQEWDVPETWKLRAQIVFGQALAPAGEKQFKPLEDRVRVFK